MNIRQALTLAATSIARRDAEVLLLHLLDRNRAWLLSHPDDPVSPEHQAALQHLVARRAAQEPLQYLTGNQEFFGLKLRVTPATLIPRPETEHLVEAVLQWTQHNPCTRILDVGTGTGAIALALAVHLPQARLTAVDLSPHALKVAIANAATLGLTDRIDFLASDLLANVPLSGQMPLFDAIVSNPPYIPVTEATSLEPEVRDHEPESALFAGPDGLDIYRRLIPQAHVGLRPGGLLALEIGFGQRRALAALLANWQQVRFINDYADIPRVALAQRPPD